MIKHVPKKIIIIAIISFFAVAIGLFSLIMASRSTEIDCAIEKFKKLDTASIICTAKQKYYEFHGGNGKQSREETNSFIYSYRKNSDDYDITCNSFTIKDNYIYMGNKWAYISDEDAIDKYESVFVRHDTSYDFYPVNAREMLVYDPTEIAEALQTHHFTFIRKKIKGEITEYKLYFGNGFYQYILRNAYAHYSTRKISASFSSPLTLTIEDGIIKTIDFKINGYFFTTDMVGNTYKIDREYFCNLTYSDDCHITVQNENVSQGFYRAVVPEKIVKTGDTYTNITFYKGKAYCVDGSELDGYGTLLKIYDLKSGNLEKIIKLSSTPNEIATQILVKDGYVYVNCNGIAYEYDFAVDTVKNIVGGFIISMTEKGVIVSIDGAMFFGKCFDNLTETENHDYIIYLAEPNKYYHIKTYNGKTSLALVNEESEIIKQIEVKSFLFNSTGVVIELQNTDNSAVKQKQLDFDLKNAKIIEDDYYYDGIMARYIDKTKDFSIYSRYIKDEKTDEHYYIDSSLLSKCYVFDNDVYFFRDGVLYNWENRTTKSAKNHLYG